MKNLSNSYDDSQQIRTFEYNSKTRNLFKKENTQQCKKDHVLNTPKEFLDIACKLLFYFTSIL